MSTTLSATAVRLGEAKNVLFDLDGCIWFGGRLATRAGEVVAELRSRGYRVFFLTNSSGSSSERLAAKLSRLGIPATAPEVLAPLAVLTRHPALSSGGPVLAVGKQVIGETLQGAGVEVTTDPEDARVVVVGNDPAMTFAGLVPAIRALDEGAQLLALNLDRRVPTEDGFAPGTGAVVAAIAAAAEKEALLVGKPSRFYFEQALELFGVSANETVMVGDSLETDVVGGQAAGMATVLVFGPPPEMKSERSDSPGSKRPQGDGEAVPARSGLPVPDVQIPDLSALLPLLIQKEGLRE